MSIRDRRADFCAELPVALKEKQQITEWLSAVFCRAEGYECELYGIVDRIPLTERCLSAFARRAPF